jgi:hypothetical protein
MKSISLKVERFNGSGNLKTPFPVMGEVSKDIHWIIFFRNFVLGSNLRNNHTFK